MLKGGDARIYLADMDRAVTFYTETLGLRLLFRAGDPWAGIDAGDGLQLGLHPASPPGPTPGTVDRRDFFAGPDGNQLYMTELARD